MSTSETEPLNPVSKEGLEALQCFLQLTTHHVILSSSGDGDGDYTAALIEGIYQVMDTTLKTSNSGDDNSANSHGDGKLFFDPSKTMILGRSVFNSVVLTMYEKKKSTTGTTRITEAATAASESTPATSSSVITTSSSSKAQFVGEDGGNQLPSSSDQNSNDNEKDVLSTDLSQNNRCLYFQREWAAVMMSRGEQQPQQQQQDQQQQDQNDDVTTINHSISYWVDAYNISHVSTFFNPPSLTPLGAGGSKEAQNAYDHYLSSVLGIQLAGDDSVYAAGSKASITVYYCIGTISIILLMIQIFYACFYSKRTKAWRESRMKRNEGGSLRDASDGGGNDADDGFIHGDMQEEASYYDFK